MRCANCGCNTLEQKTYRGLVFEECSLCGERYGSAAALDSLEEFAWADENRIPESVTPLVLALRKVEGMKFLESSGADADLGVFPSVYFQLAPASYRYLEKLMQLVDTFESPSGYRWIIDASSRGGVSFWLRPFLPVSTRKPSCDEIKAVSRDVDALADLVNQNVKLSWWEN